MLGWNRDREDFDFLETPTARSFCAPDGFVPPKAMDFRPILKVENQGPMGSCVGHGCSSGMEELQYLTAGTSVPLSRMFAYIMAQRQTGIRGDNGATIAGAVQAMRTVGICEETVFPYPNPVRYNNNMSQTALTAAAAHKILGHQLLTSAKEIFDWLSQGKGPVLIGMNWYDRVSSSRGLITPDQMRGSSAGGHCIVITGYTDQRDPQGNPLIDALNSHGINSGNKGWFQWTWDALNVLANQERGMSSIIGMTNITGFEPQRLINFTSIV